MKLSYVVLYVDNVGQTVSFYEKAFGLKHRFTHESGDYAEMETGTTTLSFASHDLAQSILKRPYRQAGADAMLLGAQITLEPQDVKAAYQQALENGAKEIAAPEIKPWNFEVAMVADCNGHIVELARAL